MPSKDATADRKNGHKTSDGSGDQNELRKRHPSSESEVSVESMEQYIPTPPDGGWGWVIVFASLCGNLIVDGISYSFGVFLLEFVDAFNEPKSKIALVGSLLSGMYLFAGPIVSALTNKFGCRPVVICGSCIATVAFVLASLSPSVEILILTYGVIGGFGLGMMYLPSIVSVGYYFEKKRALATGIAVGGSGVGTFMFPPLTEYVLEEYAWQGGLLIIAGLIFHGCLCGMLMRPLEAKPVKKKAKVEPPPLSVVDKVQERVYRERAVSESVAYSKRGGGMAARLDNKQTPQDSKTDQPSMGSPHRSNSPAADDDVHGNISPDPASSEMSEYFTPPDTTHNSPVKSQSDSDPKGEAHRSTEGKDEGAEGDRVDNSEVKAKSQTAQFITEFAPLLEVPAPRIHNGAAKGGGVGGGGSGGSRTNMSHMLTSQRSLHVSKKDLARPLYRKDIFYSGSVLNIPQFQSQPDMKSYITSITTIPGEMELVDGPSPSSKVLNLYCSCIPRSARDVFGEMVDISLLKDASFMLICLGNIAAFLGFFIPFVYIVDRAVSLGIDKSMAAFLISIIGITNTFGRVLAGFLADLKKVDSLVMTYLSITLCAVMTCLIPFCTTYPTLAVVAALFGLGVAAFVSLSSIIICDRLGLEKLTNAFGLMSMARGIAGMVGSPLAGYLFDSTGSYDMSFIIGGILLFIGAICHVFLHLPCLKSKRPVNEFAPDEIIGDTEGLGSKPQLLTMEEIHPRKERTNSAV